MDNPRLRAVIVILSLMFMPPPWRTFKPVYLLLEGPMLALSPVPDTEPCLPDGSQFIKNRK